MPITSASALSMDFPIYWAFGKSRAIPPFTEAHACSIAHHEPPTPTPKHRRNHAYQTNHRRMYTHTSYAPVKWPLTLRRCSEGALSSIFPLLSVRTTTRSMTHTSFREAWNETRCVGMCTDI